MIRPLDDQAADPKPRDSLADPRVITKGAAHRHHMSHDTIRPEPGVYVRCDARAAARFSAIVSLTRTMTRVAHGLYFLPSENEVQELRDADFLHRNGARVTALGSDSTRAANKPCG